MSESAVWGLVATIILGLVGVVFTFLRGQDARTDERLDKHITADVEAHERLARLETKVETLDVEVKTMRERYHDFRDTLTRYIGDKLDEIRRRKGE